MPDITQRPDESKTAWLDRLDRLCAEAIMGERGWIAPAKCVLPWRPTRNYGQAFRVQGVAIDKAGVSRFTIELEQLRPGENWVSYHVIREWLATAQPLPRVLAALAALNKESANA